MDLWRWWATRVLILFIVACIVVALIRWFSGGGEEKPISPDPPKTFPKERRPNATFMHTMHLPVDATEKYQFNDGANGIRVKVTLLSSDYGKLGLPHQGDLRIFLDDALASSWEVEEVLGFLRITDGRKHAFVAMFDGHTGWCRLLEFLRDGDYEFEIYLYPKCQGIDLTASRKRIQEGFSAFQVFVMARKEWFKRK